MIAVNDIIKLSRRYAYQSLAMTLALLVIGFLAADMMSLESLTTGLAVSGLFTLFVEMADALLWRWVAKSHPDSLPAFFTSVSGFRMLLALVVMLVYYLASGRQSIMSFFLVFMVFYVVAMVHHAVFFSRVCNRL